MSKYKIVSSLFSLYMLITVYSKQLPSDSELKLKDGSCQNGTKNSDGCTNSTVLPSTEQDISVTGSISSISADDNSPVTSTVADATTNTNAALETVPTSPATIDSAENNNTETTVEVTHLAKSTTSALTNHTTTQGNGKFVANATTVETTTVAIETQTVANASKVAEHQTPLLPTDSTCSCDLTLNLCDNNCCCDSECSKEDRLIFTSCYQNRPFSIDSRYCYQTEFIYRNNTEMKMTWYQEGLFCILEDNLPVTVRYKNRNKVSSLREFNRLLGNRKTFSWPVRTMKQSLFQPSKHYAAGNIIWSINKGLLMPLGLPIKVANVVCQTSRAVHFLQDYASSCSRPVPNSLDCETDEVFDAAFYYKNIRIIAKPELINQTDEHLILEQCSNSSCIPVIFMLCPENVIVLDIGKCNVSTSQPLQSPKFDSNLGICYNFVKRVRYVVYHNGTRGLTEIYAYFTLRNITLSSVSQEHFTQHFSVEFRWSNKENIFKLSGRPGYLLGKPVLAGSKITRISKEENAVDKVGIHLSNDPGHWLSTPAVNRDGSCDMSLRRPITFGDNNRIMCLLPMNVTNLVSTLTCASFQKQILNLLLGDNVDNVTESKQFNRYVATFGDSRVKDMGDWVQILIVNFPGRVTSAFSKRNNHLLGCKSIVTSVQIDVVFANVGALANPQAKILGVAFTFEKPQDLTLHCKNAQCSDSNRLAVNNVQLLTSVLFVDVTQRAETHFSEPPVYEVKLTYDFFYPFFSATETPKISVPIFLTALVILNVT